MTPIAFIHALRYQDLPPHIIAQAKRCLLDLIGVAAAGRQTELSRIVHDHAVAHMGSATRGARLLFDGRRASAAGAAYAGASTIDSFDAHDGHRLTKGHAGVAVLPALLAFAEAEGKRDGREAVTALAMGYEIALRAGIALHATATDYHTSGAWNALGCAAIGARLMGLDQAATRHALGIAEYHGPRSQMMRCIDHPTMVKDGSGWGAHAGVTAAYLAAAGFTGAPALLIEGEAEAAHWDGLGERWEMTRQYFKPHPVCRWAQPAMEATERLLHRHRPAAADITTIEIRTFAAAVRLGVRAPVTTEEAQYAIGFPVAAIAVRGKLGSEELTAEGLRDPAIADMLSRIRLVEDEGFTALFPAERWAVVTIALRDGRALVSPPTTARGDPEEPLGVAEINEKFERLIGTLDARRADIARLVGALDCERVAFADLCEAILPPL